MGTGALELADGADAAASWALLEDWEDREVIEEVAVEGAVDVAALDGAVTVTEIDPTSEASMVVKGNGSSEVVSSP